MQKMIIHNKFINLKNECITFDHFIYSHLYAIRHDCGNNNNDNDDIGIYLKLGYIRIIESYNFTIIGIYQLNNENYNKIRKYLKNNITNLIKLSENKSENYIEISYEDFMKFSYEKIKKLLSSNIEYNNKQTYIRL